MILSGTVSVVFVAAIGAIVALFLLRFIEVKMNFSLFGVFDARVQRGVSYVSMLILDYSARIKTFLLVHLYHVSSETTKSLFRQGIEQREVLLEKLRGDKPKPAQQQTEENVSPFLREISRIDRKEE